MKKSIILFCFAFAVGAAVTLAVRAARYQPPAPVASASAVAPSPVASGGHSPEQHAGAPPAKTDAGTVNSICPICGMDVDPSLPAATYEGKSVGFGCKTCPPKFAAEPDKYGPHALKNEVAP